MWLLFKINNNKNPYHGRDPREPRGVVDFAVDEISLHVQLADPVPPRAELGSGPYCSDAREEGAESAPTVMKNLLHLQAQSEFAAARAAAA